jgi:hypothetical protein
MNEKNVLVLLSGLLIYVFGMIVGNMVGQKATEMHAVENGVAQYNAKTGAFEWITPKEPERDYATEVHNEMIMNRLNSQKCE